MRSGVVSITTASSSGVGLALELLHQLALDAVQLVDRLDHVHGHADRARLVGDAARDRLADPPRRVGRELVAAAPVVLLDGAHEADVALLDEIEEEHAAADVALRDRHHEPQVGLDQLPAGRRVVALDALRERDLLGGRQQRHAADLAQVRAHRIVRAVAHGHVDRRAAASTSGSSSSSSSLDGDDLEAVRVARAAPPPRRRRRAGSGRAAASRRARARVLGDRRVSKGLHHQVPPVRGAYSPRHCAPAPGVPWSWLISSGVISAAASLLLEGFQSTCDPARLDSPGDLAQRLGPPRAGAASATSWASRRCTSDTDGASSWFSRARTQACALCSSSCVSASGGIRAQHRRSGIAGCERERAAEAIRRAGRRPCGGGRAAPPRWRAGGATRRRGETRGGVGREPQARSRPGARARRARASRARRAGSAAAPA